METSTLTNFLWIGGSILVVGAIFLFKSKGPEKPGSKPGPNPDPDPGPGPSNPYTRLCIGTLDSGYCNC